MHPLLTQAVSTAIPKLVDSGINWFKKFFESDTDKVKPSSTLLPTKPKHKITRDRSPFSIQQYDYVIEMKLFWDLENYNRPPGTSMKSKADLVIFLNEVLHKSKSQSYYAKIWNGRVKREAFPDEHLIPEPKK